MPAEPWDANGTISIGADSPCASPRAKRFRAIKTRQASRMRRIEASDLMEGLIVANGLWKLRRNEPGHARSQIRRIALPP